MRSQIVISKRKPDISAGFFVVRFAPLRTTISYAVYPVNGLANWGATNSVSDKMCTINRPQGL